MAQRRETYSGFLIWMPIWVIYLQEFRGIIRPIATGYINRRIPSDQRATVLSIFQLSAGLVLAIMVPQAGALADAVGFRESFGLLLIVMIGAGGLFAFLWRRLHIRDQMRLAVRLNSMAKPQAGTAHNPTSMRSDPQPQTGSNE